MWRPAASFLRAYQLGGGYTPGPLLSVVALAGLDGSLLTLRRGLSRTGAGSHSAARCSLPQRPRCCRSPTPSSSPGAISSRRLLPSRQPTRSAWPAWPGQPGDGHRAAGHRAAGHGTAGQQAGNCSTRTDGWCRPRCTWLRYGLDSLVNSRAGAGTGWRACAGWVKTPGASSRVSQGSGIWPQVSARR